jgi:membrane-bound lytic murein transglycosylase D
VSTTIAHSEAEFEAGRAEFDRGHLVAARDHFNRATEILMQQPQGARGEPRLLMAYEGMLDRVTALEVLALKGADGITESKSEPAAIDEVLNAATFEGPTPKATTAETVAIDLEQRPSDVPIAQNAKVLSYVELYQGRLREFMQAGLDRGQRYLPMIRTIFEEEGVPLDLAYVPLVESAFKVNALSRASARGMWQFMLPTGKEHGLDQDWFLDERADPEKATRAAAQYLKTLNLMFDGDWAFALASYNAGPGRLQRAVKSSKSTDFWTISASTRYLPRETREYVAMIMAAIVVGRNPELYGFQVASAAPLAYETVEIPGALDLKIVAEWANLTVEELQDLNPELRRTTTPMTSHHLKVPVGTAATIKVGLESADSLYRTFRFHTVKKGETVTSVARKYGVSAKALREANGLSDKARVSGQTLVIPAPSTAALPPSVAPRPTVAAGSSAGGSSSSGTRMYKVRSGDTLFSIAKQFSTTVTQIKQLNGLTSDRIKVGDQLRLPR